MKKFDLFLVIQSKILDHKVIMNTIEYLQQNYSNCVCNTIGVDNCKANCHCSYDVLTCYSNTHICACQTEFDNCKSLMHCCTCKKDVSKCKSVRHACTCFNNLDECKSVKHNCTCNKYYNCKSVVHTYCKCKFNTQACELTTHECVCPNENCKASNDTKWTDAYILIDRIGYYSRKGYNGHKCICNNYNTGECKAPNRNHNSKCKAFRNVCICYEGDTAKCVYMSNKDNPHNCVCMLDNGECKTGRYNHKCVCLIGRNCKAGYKQDREVMFDMTRGGVTYLHDCICHKNKKLCMAHNSNNECCTTM